MEVLTIILILVIVGLLWVVWKSYRHNEADKRELALAEREKDEYAEMGKGLTEYNQKMQEKKEEIKTKILEMFENNPSSSKISLKQVSNREVAEKLGVARTSAFRYLDELEKEGKLKQVGKTGMKTYYKLLK